MRKLFLFLISFSLAFNVCAADQWLTGSPAGTDSPSDIDTLIEANNNALDRLMADKREDAKIAYASAATLTVEIGQIVCDNVGRTTRKWRENTSAVTVAWTEIDTGGEEASKTYYLYAVADTDVETFTVVISLSSSAPTGATYYKRLGSFVNNSSSDIEQITNDNTYILIATGTIAHGATISLPSGYLESQCRWIVSCNALSNFDSIGGSFEWAQGYQYTDCSADGTRVVTVQTRFSGPGTPDSIAGTANYAIIGYK